MENSGATIVKIEKIRRKINTVDPADKEKLMYLSQKLDKLVVEYYRAKLQSLKGAADGARTDR